jgi:flavin-dependent dehydrogenase
MGTLDYDVAVLGAGSAGAAAALLLARTGWRVALLEARRLDAGGARWIDDVPPWMFDRAGIDRPAGAEKRGDHIPITLVGHRRPVRVEVGPRPMWGVDMRAFTARLRAQARAAGVTTYDHVVLEDVVESGGRLVEIAGGGLRVRARLFVDATGLRQALLRRLRGLGPCCPPPGPADICGAIQQVREVRDHAGARAFLDRHGIGPGHALTYMGSRGGYSTLAVLVEPDLAEVEVLAGVIGDGARRLLGELLAAEPWIGRVVFGGQGRIPLRRPYHRLAAPGVALVGDAACQTFPAHASGVGGGLCAARILADATRGRDDPGALEATWAYQAAYQRERGGVHAAYDVFRRATQRLRGDEVVDLLAGGVVDAASTRFGLDQRMPALRPAEITRVAVAAARLPRQSAGLIAAAVRMPLVERLYRAYPLRPDEKALRLWAMAARALG